MINTNGRVIFTILMQVSASPTERVEKKCIEADGRQAGFKMLVILAFVFTHDCSALFYRGLGPRWSQVATKTAEKMAHNRAARIGLSEREHANSRAAVQLTRTKPI